jgi:hypothetical protein
MGAAHGQRSPMTDPSNLNDDDITTSPTEREDDLDLGGEGERDSGDEPTEAEDDRDQGGDGERDTGDR